MNRRLTASAFLLAMSTFAACGGGNKSSIPSISESPPASVSGQPITDSTGITFTSDRSLILALNSSGVFHATGPHGGSVAWVSAEPQIATVDQSGIVHAVGQGLAVITASSAGASDTATVIVGGTGPSTVVIPSDLVYSASATQATVASSSATNLRVGSIVISGDQGGLLGRVTSIKVSGTTTQLTLSDATLADAFPNASFDIHGASQTGILSVSRGSALLRLTDGRLQKLSASALSCSGTGDPGGLDISASDNSLTWAVTIEPHVVWQTSDGELRQVRISAELVASAVVSTGNLYISSTAAYQFTCRVDSGLIPIPLIAVGPVVVDLTAEGEYGIDGSTSATAAFLLPGPTFNVAYRSEEGVQYSDGVWSSIDTGGPTGSASVNAPTNPISDSIKASGYAEPYAEAHLGASIGIGSSKSTAAVTVQLLTSRVYGKLDFSIDGSISPTTGINYSGPIWDGKIGAEVSYAPSLSGVIPELLKYFGVTTTFSPMPLASTEVKLIGSPIISLSSSGGCSVSLAGHISDANVRPLDYSGDTVAFIALNGPNGPAGEVATATVSGSVGTQSAIAEWTPSPNAPGTYSVSALLYDQFFGKLGLPYASPTHAIPVSCASPSPTPLPSILPSPAPTPSAGSPLISEFTIPLVNSRPGGITTGPDGAIWFTAFTNEVMRLSTAGTFATVFNPTYNPAGPPPGLTFGPDGAIWFTLDGADEFGRLTTSGVFTGFPVTHPVLSNSTSITTGSDGALWTTGYSLGLIVRITVDGTVSYYSIPGSVLDVTDALPRQIAAGPDGALWFTESNFDSIGRVTTAGTFTSYPIPTPSSLPYGITAGSDGAVWFTEINSKKIGRISTSGSITEFPIQTADTGIATGPDGALWFVGTGGNVVSRLTTSGNLSEYQIPTANAGPYEITAGPDGAMWFTEYAAGKIGRITVPATTTSRRNTPNNHI